MDGLLERIHELEQRTRRMEGKLRTWRLAAAVSALVAAGYVFVVPGQAQFRPVAASSTFSAPFVVTGNNGIKLLEVSEHLDRAGDGSQDSLLTLYRNGRAAVTYRTTGKVYRDAYESADNYLNVVETWLYRYPRDAEGKIDPTPYLAASTALTRGGGSIVVFSEQGKPSTTPPIAARLTAKRGVGGAIMLFDTAGNEGRVIQAK
ncbi:MAG: hypothetical protein L0Y71_19545 [Gemmataceae bacterium]|nr:hypothetical protein [Gemmataceae bacterium]